MSPTIPDGRPTGPVIPAAPLAPAEEPIRAELRPTLAELDDARAELARYSSNFAAGWLASAVRTIAAGGALLRADVAVALVVLESTR